MIYLSVSHSRLTCSGPNESFSREPGKAAWRNSAGKQRQREFKEQLPEVCVRFDGLAWISLSAPQTGMAKSRVRGPRQFR